MIRSTVLAALTVTIALPSLAGGQATPIPVTIVTEFGGSSDDPTRELTRVSGVIRTADGRFVVAIARPLEVRVIDAQGRQLATIGRAGEGPGEFRWRAHLRAWQGDSVLTYSEGSGRWALYGLDGKLAREWRADNVIRAAPRAVLIGAAFAIDGIGGDAQCHAGVIRRLAPTEGGLRQVAIAPGNRIWIRDANAQRWQVHDQGGAAMGTIELGGMIPTQFSDDLVVGHRTDEEGFSRVMAIRYGSGDIGGSTRTCDAPPATTSSRSGEVKAVLRNAMTAAEAHYAGFGRYPARIQDMAGFEVPDGLAARVENAASPNAYAFSAWDIATGYRCLVSVGGAIEGVSDGAIACGG